MKVYIASDHAGFEAKEALKKALSEKSYSIEDCGAYSLDPTDDYPDFVRQAAKKVSLDPRESRGFIFGGSGQGEAMMANRISGVRAAVYYGGSADIIKLSRQHNDANILSFGARFMKIPEIVEVAFLWLGTDFSGDERHVRRIRKIDVMKE